MVTEELQRPLRIERQLRSRQKPPIPHDEAACIDVQCLPHDVRHTIPAVPRKDRSMSDRHRRNRAVIGMLSTPGDLTSAGRSSGVRLAASEIGTHRANHHVSVGTAEHSRFRGHVPRDGDTQSRACCGRQIIRYRSQRVVVADPCTPACRRLSLRPGNRPHRKYRQDPQQPDQWRPPKLRCSAACQLTAPACEHHLGRSGRHRAS